MQVPGLRSVLGMIAALAAFLSVGAAHAQQDGARGYMLAPANTYGLIFIGQGFSGNRTTDNGPVVVGSQISSISGAVEFAVPFSLLGNAGSVFVVQPVGTIKGSVDAGPVHLANRSSGFGDTAVGVMYGLVGMPSLPLQSYLAYKPGFSATAVAVVAAPTGTYNRSEAFNFGTNRWALRTSLPLVYTLGDSFADPRLTTFELKPTLTFFSENSAPFGAKWQSQDPLLELEGHITHNLSSAFWLSADAIYYNGGATATNGVRDPNTRRSEFNLGATFGLSLSPTVQVRGSYAQSVANNGAPFEGRGVRLMLLSSF